MRGDPTPNRDNEELFKRKMRGLHQKIGAGRMHELGHGTREQFADAQAKLVYGSLPESAASATLGLCPSPHQGDLSPPEPRRARMDTSALVPAFTSMQSFFTFPLDAIHT